MKPDTENTAEISESSAEVVEMQSESNNNAAPQDAGPDLKAELDEMRDRMLRAVAEAENTRRRAQRDVEESTKYAVSSMARDLIDVAENLNRALASLPDEALSQGEGVVKAFAEGVEMTQKSLMNVLEKHGIKRVDPIGMKFDHNLHQAIAQIETPDAEAGTVVQVVQA